MTGVTAANIRLAIYILWLAAFYVSGMRGTLPGSETLGGFSEGAWRGSEGKKRA